MSGPETTTTTTTTTAALDEFAQWLARPEQAVWSILGGTNVKETTSLSSAEVVPLLQDVCQTLFTRIQQQLLTSQNNETASLSVEDTLYIGHDNDDNGAETVWGQVELQNAAALPILSKQIKELKRAPPASVRLLEDVVLEEEEELDDNGGSSSDPSSEEENDDDDDHYKSATHEESDNMDSVTERKRIEARMERAQADMDSDENDETASREDHASIADTQEFEQDRDAYNMHDGFFNLQVMEEFADEEEAYLPDQAFGQEETVDESPTDQRSFHQKQRDGDAEVEDSENDDGDQEDDDDLLFRKPNTRRKKYRADDEIDALYSLYNSTDATNNDEDDDNAIHMTAADFFGKPNQRYYQHYKQSKRNMDDNADFEDFEKSQEEEHGWNEESGDREEGSTASSGDQDENDESDDEAVPMNDMSNHAPPPTKQAARVLAQTQELEKELLAEKPWQMKGETGGSMRPVNSLLESTPEFEVAAKIAPTITMEHTENLEDVIKKRILAEDWDDVVPRELPDVGWDSKRGEAPEVSQEKSKLGLGELYEREYLKKAVGYDVEGAEKETEEEKAKNEMKTLFANLCSKLDALSNYHFAPRPVADEAEVRTVSQPAIAMEEVLPLHVSDARAVAPEEVYGKKRGRDGILRADSELDQQDRKRRRNAKKAARRKARQAKLADEKLVSRLQPGLGLSNPYEKRKMRQELAEARASGKITTGREDTNQYGDSGTFFKRMQQEAEQSIQGGKQDSSSSAHEDARKRKKSSVFKL